MELCILQFSISLTYAWISVKDQLDTHLLSDLVAKVINESLLKRPLQQKNVLDVWLSPVYIADEIPVESPRKGGVHVTIVTVTRATPSGGCTDSRESFVLNLGYVRQSPLSRALYGVVSSE